MRYSVLDFGAVADGATVNTKAFNEAVAACAAAGGGYVTVPAGKFVTGTVELKSHVYLELEPGAEVLASLDWSDFKGTKRGSAWGALNTRGINEKLAADEAQDALPVNPCKALILAEDQHHIGVVGLGTLDGRRSEDVPRTAEVGSPFIVVFSHCTDVTLQDVTMTRPGSFTNYLLACERVNIRGLQIHSTGTACGDGIDFDGGRDVTVSDCYIDAGDDGIGLKTLTPWEPCERFTITNCVIRSHFWGCIRIGPETAADYRHITVSNCVFKDSNDGIKLQLCEDRVFEDFTFSNIVMQDVTRPFFITLNRFPFSIYSHGTRPECGQMRRIYFNNITATLTERRDDPNVGPLTPWSGNVIYCLPGGVMEDIAFSHISLRCLGGGDAEWANRTDQPDMLDFVGQYPESCLACGEPPAAAFYIRNANYVRFSDISVDCRMPDGRPAFVADNVAELTLKAVRTRGTNGLARCHLCRDFKQVDCKGEVRTLTPTQIAPYEKARREAGELDARMTAIAALMDEQRGRKPHLTFDALAGGSVGACSGAVLVVPLVKGCFTVTVNGKPVERYQVPPAYRTLTCFACRLPDMWAENNTVHLVPDEAEAKTLPARLFLD